MADLKEIDAKLDRAVERAQEHLSDALRELEIFGPRSPSDVVGRLRGKLTDAGDTTALLIFMRNANR